MVDDNLISEAREEVMDGMASDKNNVCALLLMRFLRLDHSEVFGDTDITSDEMLSRAERAPQADIDRACRMCEFLSTELSYSPTSLFLCGSVAEKIQKNFDKSLNLYRKSAEHGCAAAQFNLGCLYSAGTGVVVDKEEAAKWFQLAADQNRPNAQNNLGVLYLTGQGVPMDRKKAAELFKAASKNGHVAAKQNYLIAIRPANPIKIPTAQGGDIPDSPIVSPREEVEPWTPNGDHEDVPLTTAGRSRNKRRFSFSNRFFGGK